MSTEQVGRRATAKRLTTPTDDPYHVVIQELGVGLRPDAYVSESPRTATFGPEPV